MFNDQVNLSVYFYQRNNKETGDSLRKVPQTRLGSVTSPMKAAWRQGEGDKFGSSFKTKNGLLSTSQWLV